MISNYEVDTSYAEPPHMPHNNRVYRLHVNQPFRKSQTPKKKTSSKLPEIKAYNLHPRPLPSPVYLKSQHPDTNWGSAVSPKLPLLLRFIFTFRLRLIRAPHNNIKPPPPMLLMMRFLFHPRTTATIHRLLLLRTYLQFFLFYRRLSFPFHDGGRWVAC